MPSSRPSSRSSRHSQTANVSSRAYRDHSSDEGLARPSPRRADTRDLDSESQDSEDAAEAAAFGTPDLERRDSYGVGRKAVMQSETDTESEGSETEEVQQSRKPRDLEKGKPKKVSL